MELFSCYGSDGSSGRGCALGGTCGSGAGCVGACSGCSGGRSVALGGTCGSGSGGACGACAHACTHTHTHTRQSGSGPSPRSALDFGLGVCFVESGGRLGFLFEERRLLAGCAHARTHACAHARMCACEHARMRACAHAHTRAQAHVRGHAHTHANVLRKRNGGKRWVSGMQAR